MKIKSILKKIATLGILSGLFLTSCSDANFLETYATTEDATVVYHFLQNDDNVDCIGYFKADAETKNIKEGTALSTVAKTYEGFYPSSLVTTTMADGTTAINVFYERNFVKITITFEGKDFKYSGLFGTKVPASSSEKEGYYIENWPAKFPAASQVYNAEWKKVPDATDVEMVTIAAGSFKMFNADDTRNIASFKMSKTEITQELYEKIMKDNPSAFKGRKLPVDSVTWYNALEFCNRYSIERELTPVYTINGSTDPDQWGAPGAAWEAATVDPNATGFRLPNDDEWVFAALGTNAAAYPGDNNTYFAGGITPANDITEYAWIGSNSNGTTHDVGTKKPNSNGLYDMSGNVFEWCFNIHHDALRVRMGGEFSSGSANDASVATRWDAPPSADWKIGFRIVCKN